MKKNFEVTLKQMILIIHRAINSVDIRLFNHGWQSYFTVYLIELFCILFLFFTRNITTLKFKAHAVVIVSITLFA